MKYVVTLNGKNYEVEVTESEAVITNITEAPVAAAPFAVGMRRTAMALFWVRMEDFLAAAPLAAGFSHLA